MPKQSLLVALTAVAFLAWLGEALARKRFAVMRSWLHLVVGLFALGYLLVALFSQNRYLTLVGSLGQMSWAFATLAALVVFYLVVVNHVRSVAQIYDLVLAFLASSAIAALYGLVQMFGWFPLGAATQSQNFNTIGSLYSLSVYLVAPLLMASAIAFHGCRDRVCVLGSERPVGLLAQAIVWLTIVLSLLVLILVDFWVAWAGLLLGTVLTVGLGFARSRAVRRPVYLALPVILVLVSVGLLIFRTPFHLSLPSEVAPSLRASWEIGRDTLRVHPLFGSGPGTWMYDYSLYRNQAVNLSPFWNVRFDRSISVFFTLLATTGLIGIALWLLLLISAVVKSATHLLNERNDDHWYAYLSVFVGWASFAFLGFFYNYNVAHQFAFWFLLALLGSFVSRDAWVWKAKSDAGAYALLSTLFALSSVAVVALLWVAGQRVVAESTFASGVQMYRNNQSLDGVTQKLTDAQSLNPMTDLYLRNLSQAYLMRALHTIQDPAQKDPINASHDDVATAVKDAKDAADLVPADVENWSNLAMVYQSIASFTRGADDFAIANYQEALKREPLNPAFYDSLGVLYILRADAYRTLTDSKDEKTQADARVHMLENLSLASQQLKASIAAKSDYFPAHYHLGIVYERQDRLAEATTELEQTLRANNHDTGLAFELALVYERSGKPDQALNLMQQVVRAEPNNANALWYLSALDEQLGKVTEALNVIQSLSQQLPTNQTVHDRLTYLQRLAATKAAPSQPALPEPLGDSIQSPPENNPIR